MREIEDVPLGPRPEIRSGGTRQSYIPAEWIGGRVPDALLQPGKRIVIVEDPPERHGPKRKILGFDPGGTTGMTYYDGSSWTVVETPAMEDIWWALNRWKPELVICERFVPDGGPFEVDALWIEGIIRLWGEIFQHKKKIKWNLPSDKEFASDELLKACGLWVPLPAGHGRDAIRHVIHYLVNKERDTRWIEWTKP